MIRLFPRPLPGLFLLLALAVLGSRPVIAAEPEWFQGSWAEALAVGKATGRPILAIFHKPGCGACAAHDSVLHQPEVADLLAGFLRIRVDVATPQGDALAKRMRALGTPVTVFLNKDGEELERLQGVYAPEVFVRHVKRIRSGLGTVPDLLAHADEFRDDVDFNLTLGTKLSLQGDPRARIYLDRVLALDSANAGGKADLALIQAAGLERRLEDPAACTRPLERLLKEYPQSAQLLPAVRTLAVCYVQQGDTLAAIGALERGVAAKPQSYELWNELAWASAAWKISLDRALVAAKKSVELSGADVRALDTLAEVRYARREYAEAIAAEKRAIEKRPDLKFLHERLARFEAAASGKPTAPGTGGGP